MKTKPQDSQDRSGFFAGQIRYVLDNLRPGRFGRHLGLSVFQNGVETACRTLTTIILAAILKPDAFGAFAVILAGIGLLQMISEGLWNSLTKFVPEYRMQSEDLGRRASGWATIASIVVCFAVGVLLAAAMCMFKPDLWKSNPAHLIWGFWAAVFLAAKTTVESTLRALKNFSMPAKWSAVWAPIQSAALIGAAFAGWHIRELLMILAVTYAANFLFLAGDYYIRYLREVREFWASIPRAQIARILRYSLVLMLKGFVFFFYLRVNIMVVKNYCPGEEAGYWGLADRFLLVPILLMGSFGSVTAPRIAERNSVGDREGIQSLVAKTTGTLMLSMIPFMAIFIWCAPLIRIFFPAYMPAVPVIQIFSLMLFVKAYAQLCSGALLIPGGYAKLATVITLVGSAVNLGILLMLVPRWGMMGAAVGTTLVHVASGLISIYYAHKLYEIRFSMRFR